MNGHFLWARRVFWMLAGYLLMGFFGIVVSCFASGGQLVGLVFGGDAKVLAALSIGLTVFLWCGILTGLFVWSRVGSFAYPLRRAADENIP